MIYGAFSHWNVDKQVLLALDILSKAFNICRSWCEHCLIITTLITRLTAGKKLSHIREYLKWNQAMLILFKYDCWTAWLIWEEIMETDWYETSLVTCYEWKFHLFALGYCTLSYLSVRLRAHSRWRSSEDWAKSPSCILNKVFCAANYGKTPWSNLWVFELKER